MVLVNDARHENGGDGDRGCAVVALNLLLQMRSIARDRGHTMQRWSEKVSLSHWICRSEYCGLLRRLRLRMAAVAMVVDTDLI